jgi:hypothetical protein
LIGTTFQSYHVASLYFAYKISTNVQLTIDEKLQIPRMTICFDLIQVVKWQRLTQDERRQILLEGAFVDGELETLRIQDYTSYKVNNQTEEGIDSLQETMKLVGNDYFWKIQMTSRFQKMNVSRLFQITCSYKDVIKKIMSYFENYHRALYEKSHFILESDNMPDVMTVTEFFKDLLKCYSFEMKEEYQIVQYLHVLRQGIVPGAISVIEFYPEFIRGIVNMYFVPQANGLRMTASNFAFLPITISMNHGHIVTFDTYESTFLKAPYETDCVDYSGWGLESKGNCYEDCLKKKVSAETNGKMTSPIVCIFPNETLSMINHFDILRDDSKEYGKVKEMLNRLDTYCEDQCRWRDCKSLIYSPKKMSTTPQHNNKTRMISFLPQTPKIRATCYGAVSIIQFFTDMVSALGFWLGITAIAALDSVKGLFMSIYKAISKG